jgi:hypothetical protein
MKTKDRRRAGQSINYNNYGNHSSHCAVRPNPRPVPLYYIRLLGPPVAVRISIAECGFFYSGTHKKVNDPISAGAGGPFRSADRAA